MVSATGQDATGIPVAISFATAVGQGGASVTTLYVRGDSSLAIERVYDSRKGLSIRYASGLATLQVALKPEGNGGSSQVRYTLPDGQTIELRASSDGQIEDADAILALRAALTQPTPFFALLQRYLADRATLPPGAPGGGEGLLGGPVTICADECAADCPKQCAFECALSQFSCDICMTACAIGCAIGCGCIFCH